MAKRRERPAAVQGDVALDAITDFEGLIAYLRDELEWELPEDPRFEDLTYTWKASEIGLDLKEPIEIAQLRPARSDQPWGIFFLNFPQRQLPVTVLRRILRGLSRRKRASANPAERAVWNKDDLLFVSAVGEAGDRRLAFAHFQDRGADLPTLRVIEWDADDTVRRLSAVDRTLREHLRWQERGESLDAWRERWRSAFSERPREAVRTADDLAKALAKLARRIRERINVILPQETADGPLRQLYEAVKATLTRDLTTDKFADTYAQTIAYGLLSARINEVERWQARARDGSKPVSGPVPDLADITADAAGEAMPVTNPFLRELFGAFMRAGGRDGATGLDFDELGVSEVVDFLNGLGSRLHTVLDNFDKERVGEDPVIHLYEGFLKAYDAKLRQTRGVYYTPKPVVGFIVRSVDEVLRTEFGLADGLADTTTWREFVAAHPKATIPDGVEPDDAFVRILDPATGTGTFLVEIIDFIHARLWTERWRGKGEAEKRRLWNEWVPRHLLPRLNGYELMMAPYAVAHMKIGLKLQETGYDFAGTEAGPDGRRRPARARVFLTNTLEPAHDLDMQLAFMSEALAHEAHAANDAKARTRFTVVVGNPPYSKLSSNMTANAAALIEPYRFLDGVKIVEKGALALEMSLQDDYVKFLACVSGMIRQSEIGCCSLITNFRYLSAVLLRGARNNILTLFDRTKFTNLGGQISERTNQSVDENVFDIEQGVAIGLLVKTGRASEAPAYARISGSRDHKYNLLSQSDVQYVRLSPRSPLYALTAERESSGSDYDSWWKLDDAMPFNSGGVITSRDNLLISFSKEEALSKIRRFAASGSNDEELLSDIGFSVKAKWDIEGAKSSAKISLNDGTALKRIEEIRYRPYDDRYIYYDIRLIDTPSKPVHDALTEPQNLVLLTPKVKNTESFSHVAVSRFVAEKKAASHDRATQMFPAFVKRDLDRRQRGNFAKEFLEAVSSLGKLEPQDLVRYITAVLHSPRYRLLYGRQLMDDYPRIPLPRARALFAELIPLGTRLVALHLLDAAAAPELANPKPRLAGEGEARVERGYPERHPNGRVYINPRCWFEPVPESVWAHPIGGYKPAEKWLKDRSAKGGKRPSPGRVLTDDDILHYRRIVVALDETAKAMAAIDAVIARHGGWPDAFRGMADMPPADVDRSEISK